MLRSAGILHPCVKRRSRYSVGLSNLDNREGFAVNQIVGRVGPNFQNFLHLFDLGRKEDGSLIRKSFKGRTKAICKERKEEWLAEQAALPCALRAEVCIVVKVHCWLV